MQITPSSSTVMLGQDSNLVYLNCSVFTNPLTPLKWTRRIGENLTEPLEAYQPPVSFNTTSFSILSVNIDELGPGTHTFECRVDIIVYYYVARYLRNHTVSANITVLEPPPRSSSLATSIPVTHALGSSVVDFQGKF